MKLDNAMLAVGLFAGSDETRLNLNCLRVESGRVIATDGYILAEVQAVEPQEGFACQIGREDVDKLSKLMPKWSKRNSEESVADVSYVGTYDQTRLAVQIGADVKTEAPQHEGEFPDVAQMYPKGKPTYRVAFNLDLLDRLGAIARAADTDHSKQAHLVLEFFDEPSKSLDAGGYSPIRVTAMNAPRFLGLLMPMRAPRSKSFNGVTEVKPQ